MVLKRFVTYLYEYEKGRKSKNTGFIRVDVRKNVVSMRISIQNYSRMNEVGNLCLLIKKKELLGIYLGEVNVLNGQGESHFQFYQDNILESGCILDEVVGAGIQFRNNGYLASCWKDEDRDEICKGNYRILEKALEEEVPKELAAAETLRPEMEEVRVIPTEDRKVSGWYKKIQISDIHNLPNSNWHLCNNSFLVHGFSNYGYLLLKTQMEEGVEKTYLGVPGFFERAEMMMAMVFGFEDFEGVPKKIVDMPLDAEGAYPLIEKEQQSKHGIFGCWYTLLQD